MTTSEEMRLRARQIKALERIADALEAIVDQNGPSWEIEEDEEIPDEKTEKNGE